MIDDLVRIYSYDVDFQRRAQPGDSFEVLYRGEDETPDDANNDVLFAALTVGGETKKFYRYPVARRRRRRLLRRDRQEREEVPGAQAGRRRHHALRLRLPPPSDPRLFQDAHRRRLGRALGTPIFASGNGVVEKVGWEGGYGKYVRVKHNNGYETAYGHMSAFARGIEPGKRVRQGQVIGFVGSTGLSTGAHVHYEIVVNGRFVDPMRIRLPRGRVLEGPILASFEKERERIDSIITRSSPRVAQASRRADFRSLFRGDRVAQRQRRRDAMQMLMPADRVVGGPASPPVPMTCTRTVVEDPAQDRLVDIHRCDLVHVHLDGVPGDEASLVDHAPIGDRDLGGPADEPADNEPPTSWQEQISRTMPPPTPTTSTTPRTSKKSHQ